MDGILNINKPMGLTSFDVVARVRKLTDTKKVGHAGTLDPDATGVLPVCVGKATKIIEFLMDKDKSYRVELVLGKATDTQDASGKTLYEKAVLASNEEIERTIRNFTGCLDQIPPMYSAIRVDGRRLYDLARQGIEVERKPRQVTIHSIDVLCIEKRIDQVGVLMDVTCSKGTYMRTLCHDIGKALGCGGHMSSLVRTRSGPFSLEDSHTLDNLSDIKACNQLETFFVDMDQAILHLPRLDISRNDAKRLKNGLPVALNNLTPGFIRVYHEDGYFLAIGKSLSQNGIPVLRTYKWIGCDELMKG